MSRINDKASLSYICFYSKPLYQLTNDDSCPINKIDGSKILCNFSDMCMLFIKRAFVQFHVNLTLL